jgi:hypothetical protein
MHSDSQAKSVMKELIIGVFRRPRAARRAIEALREFGFLDNQLGLLSSDPLPLHEPRPAMGRRAPFEAEHLAELGLPAQEVSYYLREIDRGHSLIVVDPHERTLHAMTVLERQSPFERAIFRLTPFVAPVEADAALAAAG